MSDWRDLRDNIKEALVLQDETRPGHLPLQILPNSSQKNITIPIYYLGFFPKARTFSSTKKGGVMVYDTSNNLLKVYEVHLSFKKLLELVETVRKEHLNIEDILENN